MVSNNLTKIEIVTAKVISMQSQYAASTDSDFLCAIADVRMQAIIYIYSVIPSWCTDSSNNKTSILWLIGVHQIPNIIFKSDFAAVNELKLYEVSRSFC